MTSAVSNLSASPDQRSITWDAEGKTVTFEFAWPVKAVKLRSGTGVLLVEPGNGHAPHNAVIFNADGTIRIRITNPAAPSGAIAFHDAYYVLEELTLIIAFSSWQMACVIDEQGTVLRTYETR